MKTRAAYFILLLLLTVNAFFATAQQYSFRESETKYEDFFHDLFSVNASPEKYIVVNYTGRHGAFSFKRDELNTSIDVYNAQLQQTTTNAIKELKGKKYIGGFSVANKLFLFYVENETGVFRFELNPDKATSASAPEKVFSFTGQNFQFFKGASPDSSYFYVISANHDDKSKDEKYDGIILDKQMKVFSQFSFKIDELREYTASTVFVLSDKGILDVVSAIRVKTEKSNYTPVIYQVRQISKDGLEFNKTLNDLPEGLFTNVVWQNNNDRLEFTGLVAKSKKEGFTSVLSGALDADQHKVVDIKNSEINISVLQGVPPKFAKEIIKEGIPKESAWAGSYMLKDGSQVILSEPTLIDFDRYGVAHIESLNIYVYKISPKKEIEWVRVIPKHQFELADEIQCGFISLKDKDDGIHIYFHDNSKNDNVESDANPDRTLLEGKFKKIGIADLYINKSGKITKRFIQDDSGSDFQLSTHNYLILPEEILYTSYYRRNLGKSEYRLGVMSFK